MSNRVGLLTAAAAIALLAGCSSNGGNDSAAAPADPAPEPTEPAPEPTDPAPFRFSGTPLAEFRAAALAAAGAGASVPAETAIAEQLMTARREVPNADSLNASAIYFEAPGATDTSRNDVARCEDAACGYAFSLGGETLTVIYRLADVFEVTDPGLLDAVLTDDDGITLLRRRPGNALDHTFYGAWMENAGFIVAADGEFLIPREGDSGITIPGRAAVAGGERESGLPTADASWTGLMVGTFQSGDEVDDILQGQAELTFSVQSNRIGAMFSSIRNIDNPRAADNRIADITFQNLEANADNGTYGTETEGSRIAGAFYGDGRAETAGIFERDNIVAAFGARRVTTN